MKRLLWLTMLSLLNWSLTGCANQPAIVSVDYCEHARPIWFDATVDVYATPVSVRRQVLENNKTWVRLCSSSGRH